MAELDYQYIGELVKRACSGDSDAFAELYVTTYQKQYMFAYSYLKDEYLAQDALQETYITALKNLSSIRDPKLFISWLNQINFRVCFTMANKQNRYNSEINEYNDEYADNLSSHDPTPEDQVIDIDNKEYIIQQVMALPYSESQVILLHYYKNMKLEDIAYLMEISRSTVKRYLASGKERLAKSISV